MPKFSSKRRVQHTAPQMFYLVADVERYPEFVPFASRCGFVSARRSLTAPKSSSPT